MRARSKGRYVASTLSGVTYILLALVAGTIVAILGVIPGSLTNVLIGMVLVKPVINAIEQTWRTSTFATGAFFAFFIAVSGVTFLGISAPFWALVGGAVASLMFEFGDYRDLVRGEDSSGVLGAFATCRRGGNNERHELGTMPSIGCWYGSMTRLPGSRRAFPHYADPQTGEWTTSEAGDWTGGFWNGMLWLAYAATKEQKYLDWAERWTELLRPRAPTETIFRGFLFYYGAALGDILMGNPLAKDVGLSGAKGLATLYNPNARVIPLGEEAEEASDVGRADANIDGVQGTSLLIWASKYLDDQNLYDIGIEHALRINEFCVREDNSVCSQRDLTPRVARCWSATHTKVMETILPGREHRRGRCSAMRSTPSGRPNEKSSWTSPCARPTGGSSMSRKIGSLFGTSMCRQRREGGILLAPPSPRPHYSNSALLPRPRKTADATTRQPRPRHVRW